VVLPLTTGSTWKILEMPDVKFDILAVTRTLEDGKLLAEALLFPEFSCCGEDLAKLHNAIQRNAKRMVEDMSPLGLHRRQLPSTPKLEQVTITVEPQVRSIAWQGPVELGLW